VGMEDMDENTDEDMRWTPVVPKVARPHWYYSGGGQSEWKTVVGLYYIIIYFPYFSALSTITISQLFFPHISDAKKIKSNRNQNVSRIRYEGSGQKVLIYVV
jgi:hypothetical protein